MRKPVFKGLTLFMLLFLVDCRTAPTRSPRLTPPADWLFVVQKSGPRWLGPDWWRAQGIDPETLNPHHVHLFSEGHLAGFVWSDSPTGPGLLFLGQTQPATIGPIGVYTLTVGSSDMVAPLHDLSSVPTSPFQRTTRVDTWFEENEVYRTTAPLDSPWFWTSLNAPEIVTLTLPLTSALSLPVTATLRFWGQSRAPQRPDHHIRTWWNGTLVDDHTWDGSDIEEWTVRLPTARAGDNVLALEAPGDTEALVDVTWLDAVRLTWRATMTGQRAEWGSWLAEDFASACWENLPDANLQALLVDAHGAVYTSPVYYQHTRADLVCMPQIPEAQGWVGVPWDAPLPDRIRQRQTLTSAMVWDADYVMIASDMFHNALSPLVQARQDEGFEVVIVTPEQIYDTYGSGVPEGQVIRQFVLDLQARGHLRYLLLVGDTSADPREMWAASAVPTLWERTVHVGATPSDWALVADDAGDPTVAIGRFPVSTVAELEALVAKTLAWTPTARMLVLSDDEPAFARMRDALLDVSTSAEHLDAGRDDARRALLHWLRTAPGFFVYSGHGSLPMLGDEQLLTFEDARLWKGPTVVAAWTCLCANYTHPLYPALSEVWLRDRHGAVAFVGPTGETTTAEQFSMAVAFQAAVVGGERLGDALLAGWRAAHSQDVRVGFLLLGDPALRVFSENVR